MGFGFIFDGMVFNIEARTLKGRQQYKIERPDVKVKGKTKGVVWIETDGTYKTLKEHCIVLADLISNEDVKSLLCSMDIPEAKHGLLRERLLEFANNLIA